VDPAAAMGGAGRDALRASTGTGRRRESVEEGSDVVAMVELSVGLALP